MQLMTKIFVIMINPFCLSNQRLHQPEGSWAFCGGISWSH